MKSLLLFVVVLLVPASLSAQVAMRQGNGTLQIGNSKWDEQFSGLIDQVRIYTYALSLAEIQANMKTAIGGGTKPSEPVPVDIRVTSDGKTLSVYVDGKLIQTKPIP